jgi:hypothetical protein
MAQPRLLVALQGGGGRPGCCRKTAPLVHYRLPWTVGFGRRLKLEVTGGHGVAKHEGGVPVPRIARYSIILGLLAGAYFLTLRWAQAAECGSLVEWSKSFCQVAAPPPTYSTPKPYPNSPYGRTHYARLADNANVYPGPSRSAAPIRNVGDGFIFVTVNSWDRVNGKTWYQINAGEYVHQDDIRLVNASGFQGVAINRQPERPFGWIVQEVQPSGKPDGDPDPQFSVLPRLTFFEIYNAVVGEDDWIWYNIGSGRWVKQTYMSIIEPAQRPEEVGPNEFWTQVDLYEQTFAAYEGDRMVYATLISSGLNRWPTREGLFQVWDRFEKYKMSGAEGQIDYYYIEDVPYIMYFDRLMGIALHGTYWHNRFGYKHSHGCVNMPILDAEWVFHWSAQAPNDLWVWVHTSDPVDHLARFQ